MDSNVADPKQAIVDKLKQSTNILVTVSANPTVDQLAACLGLTLWLNKIDKHATAVFSGSVPDTIEFLRPEETLEKNTDSLRDFIIALDKSKADKLRYKVEDAVVKIFITPYRTSLSADDLEFSQGDFNVDMVVALGVHVQQDLDTAITAHGRILHDATVATITTGEQASELGSISWHDVQASSLSELVVELGNAIDQQQLDGQIATALLTGIVAETARFSNERTTPQTMSISAQLMSAGANQQLVASKLEEPAVAEATDRPEATKSADGTLEINHPADDEPTPESDFALPAVADTGPAPIDEPTVEPVAEPEQGTTTPEVTDVKTNSSEPNALDQPALVDAPDTTNDEEDRGRLITEPPTLGGTLTANSRPDDVMLEPTSDPLSQDTAEAEKPLLDRESEPATDMQPAPPSWMPPQPWMNQPPADTPQATDAPLVTDTPAAADSHDQETLADIEREVGSPHVQGSEPSPNLETARDEVMKAIDSAPNPAPEPIQALNAQPIDLGNDQAQEAPAPTTAFDPAVFGITNDPDPDVAAAASQPLDAPNAAMPDVAGPVDQPFTLPVPGALAPPPANPVPPTSTADKPAPPPVPPPITNL
jgi:hypothetical protein